MKTNTISQIGTAIITASLMCFLPLHIYAKPRPPQPPWPETELQRWSFDGPYYASTTAKNSSPLVVDSSIWQESWSGYALVRSGEHVVPVGAPMATTNRWNVAPTGTIRFWYAPNWSSRAASGSGPQHNAKLLELSLGTGTNSAVVWDLRVSADGNSLLVSGDTDNGPVDYLAANISWTANQWHLLTVSYATNQTLLYVDNELVASGQSLPVVPLATVGLGSLTIGSSLGGQETGEGLFDEVTTFYQTIQEMELGFYYDGMRPVVDQGPITPAEEAAQQQRTVQAKTMRMKALSAETQSMQPMTQSLEYTNGFYLLQPVIQDTNIFFSVANADTNKSYDIYFVPALLSSSNNWTLIAAHGAQGQTNFTAVLTEDMGFYQAAEGDDWDGDGIKNWEDANPTDPTVGILTISIDSPADGTVMQ